MSSPQIIISLSPNGELITELPGLNGSRRKINLKQENIFTPIVQNAIECLKAFQNYHELETEYNSLASKTIHKGTKEEREKNLAEDRLKSAKLTIEETNFTIAALTSILSTNDLTTGIILQILNSQQTAKHAIGEDGNPTEQQVIHWQRHGILCDDPECKITKKGGLPHSHKSPWSDPSCAFCQSEGRFEAGYNREDTRDLRGLSEYEALRLGLTSRGFTQSKNNPEIWNKKNMMAIFLKPNGKVLNSKFIEWSREHHAALIADGKLHAQKFGFTKTPAKFTQGNGKVKVIKQTKFVKETSTDKIRRKMGSLTF